MAKLPPELLWYIATLSPSSFVSMLAVPSVARYACEPHVQAAMKKHFLVKRNCYRMLDVGTKTVLPNGLRHSRDDEPAVIWQSPAGIAREWYRDGELHRDGDQPAQILPNGSKMWMRRGVPHRDGDQPAFIFSNGLREWYQNGEIHRAHDRPAIILEDVHQTWYERDAIHRDNDLPARVWDSGRLEWYQNNQMHRARGPARIYPNGDVEYWKYGQLLAKVFR